MMTNIPMPQQIYRHFKGNLYQIVSIAEHTETGEQLVIYQALYGDFKIYARPLSMFMSKVDCAKYPQAAQEYRFELVERNEEQRSGDTDAGITAGESQLSGAEKEEQQAIKPAAEMKAQKAGVSGQMEQQSAGEEALNIDPLVLQFLDAGSYEERLDILSSLHYRITDDMINTMALAIDVEVKEGDIEERYAELRKCLLLYDKFECTRLR